MSIIQNQYERLIKAMGVEGLVIPTTLVKFYRHEENIPEALLEFAPEDISLTSCQATKQASLGDAVLLSKNNIGCVAAAISLGLVDENQTEPLEGPRVYTELMREHSDDKQNFTAPSPSDFTEGKVYACKDACRKEFSLFGEDDCGRYSSVTKAKEAIAEMTAIQPAVMKSVFFYSPDFLEAEIIPDIVVCSLRPVELTRFIQAYQFNAGKRINASMGGLRAVNSDLIARPYLTGEINLSAYCLGSRLIAKYDGDQLGIGMPYKEFETIVNGMEDSAQGFPFADYPGADH